MTEQQVVRNEVVADYVRSSMRVDVPQTLIPEIMRAAASTPQVRRPWFHALVPFAPAFAAVAATALIVVVGLLATSSPDVGPGLDADDGSQDPTPRPTLTPEDARILTEPGDTIRVPAFDSDGEFGTIVLERGDEFASYEDYMPMQAAFHEEVFFVEVHVTYEPTGPADDPYGAADFGYAIDVDANGLDPRDPHTQWFGVDVDGEPLTTGPSPLLPWVPPGDEPISGWLVVEIPASNADRDLYLVQLGPDEPNGRRSAVASALLREPGPPVGVTTFDPEALPTPSSSDELTVHLLPTPPPSPQATFLPIADADADALFEQTQTCSHPAGVVVTFPASWYTNEAGDEFSPACSMFGPEPIDMSQFEGQFVDEPLPPVILRELSEDPAFGMEQPQVERVPLHGRLIWRVYFTEEQMSSAARYLISLGEGPYAPFLSVETNDFDYDVLRHYMAIAERMLLLMDLPSP